MSREERRDILLAVLVFVIILLGQAAWLNPLP